MTSRAPTTAALVGRQNAGKTSLLMHVTGTSQKPVNFPGSSVERGEATVTLDGQPLRLVDLPGLASLTPISRDEAVAIDFLRTEGGADVLCAVVDASKLSVELQLVLDLMALGRPLVIALNKVDVAAAAGRAVDPDALSDALGVPVVVTDALTGDGAPSLGRALLRSATLRPPKPPAASPDELARAATRETERPRGPSLTDRVDRIVLHRWLGLPLLAVILFGIFQVIFVGAEPLMGLIEAGQDALGGAITAALDPGALRSFLVDGLIGGLGSIVIFVPQIALLMLLVSLLEATGYMARAAFILDRPLRKLGLSGRSFVPLVSSFACAVPGILATRIIEDERDRLATIAVAPLMSCSARLPVYVVLIGAFFPASQAGLVLFSLYALGIVVAAAVAFLLRRTVLRGGHSVLMMELPVYQRPVWRVVGGQVWAALKEFFILAGTVIFAAAILIWLLSYYPRPAELHDGFEAQRAAATATLSADELEPALEALDAAERAAYLEQSFLADAGKAVQPLFAPAGFDWRTTVGVLASFPARELIIPTLGVLYSLGDVDPGVYTVDTIDDAPPEGLRRRLVEATNADGERALSPLIALAIMVFFALCSQCIATLGTIRRETRSWRWPTFTFVYMTVLAWIGAVLVYQVGSALGYA